MTQKQSEAVTSAAEMTSLRRNTEARASDDILEWLLSERDLSASVAAEEFQKGDLADYNVINPAVDRSDRYARAAAEIERSRELIALMTESLRNRILVALAEAKAPEWVPTHRHYKGTEYRVTGTRMDAEYEELIEKVEYDDREGNRYVLSRSRFESFLGSGKPRYEFIGLSKREDKP